jgi:hypothetical protein
MRKRKPNPSINPIAHAALAASTAARVALDAIAQPADEHETTYDAALAVMRTDPTYALCALHDYATELDIARIAQDREHQVEHLCAIRAAGAAVATYLVDQAAAAYGGDHAALINAALKLEDERPRPTARPHNGGGRPRLVG